MTSIYAMKINEIWLRKGTKYTPKMIDNIEKKSENESEMIDSSVHKFKKLFVDDPGPCLPSLLFHTKQEMHRMDD